MAPTHLCCCIHKNVSKRLALPNLFWPIPQTRKMLQSLTKVVGKPGTAGTAITSTGAIITASEAFSKAGLSLSDGKKYLGLSVDADDLFVSAIAGESACRRQARYRKCLLADLARLAGLFRRRRDPWDTAVRIIELEGVERLHQKPLFTP